MTLLTIAYLFTSRLMQANVTLLLSVSYSLISASASDWKMCISLKCQIRNQCSSLQVRIYLTFHIFGVK